MDVPLQQRTPARRARGPRTAAHPARTVGELCAFGVLPLLLLVLFLATGGPARGFDFRQFWQGGRDVLEGISPYPHLTTVPAGAAARALDPDGIQHVFRFPYPAPTAVAIAPLAALPAGVATAVMLALLVLSIPAALALLGVRDWRCYGAAFLWMPVLGATRLGTLTPILLLGIAALWRFRDRRAATALLVAGLVVAKLFLWPLLIWLAATRRTAVALAATGASLALTVGGWAVIGFAGFRDYPALMQRLGDAVGWKSYSLSALADAAGAPGLATALTAAVGVVALAAVVVAGRRPGGDGVALGIAILASLACSPIVWLHYFALALVPVAISSRRLSAAWLLPLGLWITPYQEAGGRAWAIVLALALVSLTVLVTVRPQGELLSGLPAAARSHAR